MKYAVVIYLVLLLAGTAVIYFRPGQPGVGPAASGSPEEQQTANYFNSIREEPGELLAFLRQMPKGGDLHSHLSGATYAETLIESAARLKRCINKQTLLVEEKCGPDSQGAETLTQQDMRRGDIPLYRRTVDAWSMRNKEKSGQSGHDHFFDTFGKFGLATHLTGDMLADVVTRAAGSRVSYLELMLTPDNGLAKKFAAKLVWTGDFGGIRQQLLNAGLRDQALAEVAKTLDEAETRARELMQCSAVPAKPECNIPIRYLFQVARAGARIDVFSQMVTAFEVAQVDKRVVGLNLVEPEDYPVPRRDFMLHMQMLDFLHGVYPNVNITLHAGELTLGLVPPADLRYHVRASVELGPAKRIGHGVDVMHEDSPVQLLQEMAARNVMVEICLTSNEGILGVRGKDHPLNTYIKHGVPVALATDDEGISRSDMTNEYLKAVQDQGLDYQQLKRMARTSLQHAFLTGQPLWLNQSFAATAEPCSADRPEGNTTSSRCRQFLDASEKASLQWDLEKAFAQFERQYARVQ